MKTIESINGSIRKRRAKVFTASEIKEMVRNGNVPEADDVDVVTCGTFGVMSGTMAVLSVPVSDPGAFRTAEEVTFNGVPGIPGPCPNENLGTVDCIVYGTAGRDGRYGGGHLFRDMVEGKDIEVEVTSSGNVFRRTLTIKDMFARMIVTRGAFRNYTAFVNPSGGRFRTIFSVAGMEGPLREGSVSGCGDISPLQNDPRGSHLTEGTRILLNGGDGTIMGPGTRSSEGRRNISAFADMKGMDGNMMGGFITSAGPECLTSFAAAIPILDKRDLENVCVLNEDIPLPVADIMTRTVGYHDDYGSVWNGTSSSVRVDRKACLNCKHCNAEEKCPVSALSRTRMDRKRCMVCGACVRTCTGNVFSAHLGHVTFDGKAVPITLRQSDRNRAESLSEGLKERIMKGDWRVG